MITQNDPPRKKKGPEKDRGKEPSPEATPAKDKAENKPAADLPSEEEVISTWSDPVTNQDEQEKITNAGGGDIPIPDK